MNEVPLTVSAIRNDGESVRLSFRDDNGHVSRATIPCEYMDHVVQTLVQGFLAASVRASRHLTEEGAPQDFQSAPQMFRADDIQIIADLHDSSLTFLVIPTVENIELVISLQPPQLRRLIELARQREVLQGGGPGTTN